MHASKHAILDRLEPTLRARLHAAAAANRVTVDDVVRAGLGRHGTPEAASRAALVVVKELPGAFQALRAWPETCPFCLDVVSSAPEACAYCAAAGCCECVRSDGCPTCQAKAREAMQEARRVARLRARLVKTEPQTLRVSARSA